MLHCRMSTRLHQRSIFGRYGKHLGHRKGRCRSHFDLVIFYVHSGRIDCYRTLVPRVPQRYSCLNFQCCNIAAAQQRPTSSGTKNITKNRKIQKKIFKHKKKMISAPEKPENPKVIIETTPIPESIFNFSIE